MTCFTFSTEELNSLATSHEGITQATEAAIAEAKATGIGDWQMYGAVCSPIAVPVLSAAHAALSSAQNELCNVIKATHQQVVTTCEAYQAVEDQHVALAGQISAAI